MKGIGFPVNHNNVSLRWELVVGCKVRGASQSLSDVTLPLHVDPVPRATLEELIPAKNTSRRWQSETITVILDHAPAVWQPGQSLVGKVAWQAGDKRVERAEVRLCPVFQGRPLEVSERVVFDAPKARDRRSIELQLPTSPYSFAGEHVKVRWVLEVILMPCDEVFRVSLDIVPAGDHRNV